MELMRTLIFHGLETVIRAVNQSIFALTSILFNRQCQNESRLINSIYKSDSGTILGFNDCDCKSGISIE